MTCLLVQNGPTIVDTYRHYIINVVQRQYDVTRVPLHPPRALNSQYNFSYSSLYNPPHYLDP